LLTPLIGLLVLAGVGYTALVERPGAELGFFDPHAGIVVFGGVIGALFLANEQHDLKAMLRSVVELFPIFKPFHKMMAETQAGLHEIRTAWREGRRSVILSLVDKGKTSELRLAADVLLQQLSGDSLTERFMQQRTKYLQEYGPVVEGWEMVGKLAPSFGMVGTVTGMVQLFKNMADDPSNLGGAMAMALLATLYGIATGAAVGGPMASRINNQLNERLSQLDLIEKTVCALLSETRQGLKQNAGEVT
jgi:chemotaxis protein MotA